MNTDKKVCRIIAEILHQAGIEHVVISPGTRNAPLITAMTARKDLTVHAVVDERMAAFIATGMSHRSGKPVALVCTSGTAPLNYGPAVAEAYYRHIPLVVITADRPADTIDKLRGQTIHQPGIYRNYICKEIDVPCHDYDNILDMVPQMFDAEGPIHINVQLEEPLGSVEEFNDVFPDYQISRRPERHQSLKEVLHDAFHGSNTLVVIGHDFHGSTLPRQAVELLNSMPGVVVMAEATAGIKGFRSTDITAILTIAKDHLPTYLITIGGALVAQSLTSWAMAIPGLKHISVSTEEYPIDTYGCLTGTIKLTPEEFGRQLLLDFNSPKKDTGSPFKKYWENLISESHTLLDEYLSEAPWGQWVAMDYIFRHAPGCDLHFSNGMTVRYAQGLIGDGIHSLTANRGVSGIDGSTSTAIGAAVVSPIPTWLITGDMSFQYDMGALACNFIPPDFKIIVINNNGGGIFRFIKNTRGLPMTEKYLAGVTNVPVKGLAAAFGFNYFKASSKDELKRSFNDFAGSHRAILEIITDSTIDNTIFHEYLKKLKTI